MKRIYFFITFFVILFILIIVNYQDSYSIEMDNINDINLILEDNSDINILKDNIYNYIDMIDDNLITNSSYNMSNILSENYDFLVNFSIAFILNNIDYYEEDIITMNEYTYMDLYGNTYRTDKYISIDTLYDITYNVFGKRYFYIDNEIIKVRDNLLPLLNINSNNIIMNIDNIQVVKINNGYNVYVKYQELEYKYIYNFINVDNHLVINNVSIEV
ncbi:MAG: hypothetical protein IJZ79_04490 [Bacilli bacterium]|nr:hypothetical protein [Bacilli bacterium]